MKENEVLKHVQLLGRGDVRLFRNNTGSAWMGDANRTKSGDMLIRHARSVKFGLCVGSSDLIGWKTVEVTPDMVGKRIAVFVALECKTESGRATAMQKNFIKAVQNAGGLSGIVRSKEEGEIVLGGQKIALLEELYYFAKLNGLQGELMDKIAEIYE